MAVGMWSNRAKAHKVSVEEAFGSRALIDATIGTAILCKAGPRPLTASSAACYVSVSPPTCPRPTEPSQESYDSETWSFLRVRKTAPPDHHWPSGH